MRRHAGRLRRRGFPPLANQWVQIPVQISRALGSSASIAPRAAGFDPGAESHFSIISNSFFTRRLMTVRVSTEGSPHAMSCQFNCSQHNLLTRLAIAMIVRMAGCLRIWAAGWYRPHTGFREAGQSGSSSFLFGESSMLPDGRRSRSPRTYSSSQAPKRRRISCTLPHLRPACAGLGL